MTAQGKPDRCPSCGSDERSKCNLLPTPAGYEDLCCDDWHSSPIPAAAMLDDFSPEDRNKASDAMDAAQSAPQAESVPSGKDAADEFLLNAIQNNCERFNGAQAILAARPVKLIKELMRDFALSQTAAIAAERDQLQRCNDGIMETLRHYEVVINIAYYLFVSDGKWDKSANCWKNARAEKAERENSLLRERLNAIEKILRENERDGYGYCNNQRCGQFAPNHDENCWLAILLLSFKENQ